MSRVGGAIYIPPTETSYEEVEGELIEEDEEKPKLSAVQARKLALEQKFKETSTTTAAKPKTSRKRESAKEAAPVDTPVKVESEATVPKKDVSKVAATKKDVSKVPATEKDNVVSPKSGFKNDSSKTTSSPEPIKDTKSLEQPFQSPKVRDTSKLSKEVKYSGGVMTPLKNPQVNKDVKDTKVTDSSSKDESGNTKPSSGLLKPQKSSNDKAKERSKDVKPLVPVSDKPIEPPSKGPMSPKSAKSPKDLVAVKDLKPTKDIKSTKDTKPVDDTKPSEGAKPDAKPVKVVKSAGDAKPVKNAKPVHVSKLVSDVKPVKDTKPVSDVKPVKDATPVKDVKPIKDAKPFEVTKATKDAKSDKDVPQPIQTASVVPKKAGSTKPPLKAGKSPQSQPKSALPDATTTTNKSTATAATSDSRLGTTDSVTSNGTDKKSSILSTMNNNSSIGLTTTLMIEPYAAMRVIKGEIHNLYTVIRATSSGYNNSNRYQRNNHDHQEHNTISVIQQELSELQHRIMVSQNDSSSTANTPVTALVLDNNINFWTVFCHAITSSDVNAVVTGAALAAVNKFLLYGFLLPLDTAETQIRQVAQAILQCTFEEGGSGSMGSSTIGGAGNALLRRNNARYDEEAVVLQLLQVATLVLRISLQNINPKTLLPQPLLPPKWMVGLLDIGWHVCYRAERASTLLRSAAHQAVTQMILQIFSSNTDAENKDPIVETRLAVWKQLAHLLQPPVIYNNSNHNTTPGTSGSIHRGSSSGGSNNNSTHSIPPVTTSSGLLTHAGGSTQLSTIAGGASGSVVVNTTTTDPRITLSVLNVALETCRNSLTKPEIRILQNSICKSLLQWSSAQDLSVISLTLRVIFNLFQSIRNHLKVQLEVFLTSVHLRMLDNELTAPDQKEIVLESLLEYCQEPALLQDIYRNYDCDVACTNLYELIANILCKVATPTGWDGVGNEGVKAGSLVLHNQHPPTTIRATGDISQLNLLALEGIVVILDNCARRCQGKAYVEPSTAPPSQNGTATDGDTTTTLDDSSLHTISNGDAVTDAELHERRQKKYSLHKVASAFNSNPMSDDWLILAVTEKLISSKDDTKSVAGLLYKSPKLDKACLGTYLSKGPAEKFPYIAEVRQRFVETYDFQDLPFAAALRSYLSKFRLPGEAQCIDRLMEAFSKRLFEQQGETTMFKNSDAVYVLSFSTIMLNTDLHNPTIKQDKRMTSDQFVKNNRGINGGDDLSEEFLQDLYDQIKFEQIQVRQELGEFMEKHKNEDFRTVWDGMLEKNKEVAAPIFTPIGSNTQSQRSDFHDKEMFRILATQVIEPLHGIFVRSWDDNTVLKTLQCLQQTAKAAAYFGLHELVDKVMQILLRHSYEYIQSCINLEYSPTDPSYAASSRSVGSVESGEDNDDTSYMDPEQPIPYALLCTNRSDEDYDTAGAAVHKGLLAMNDGFLLARKYAQSMSGSWEQFVMCLCALRDTHALPSGLADLDDFADSNGNVLPLSSFAMASQRQLEDFYKAQADPDANKKKGWFAKPLSFFNKKKSNSSDDISPIEAALSSKPKMTVYTRTLLNIAELADVEQITQVVSTNSQEVEEAITSLLDIVDKYPYNDEPAGEQHAVFALELAVRALLSNRERAPSLFYLFLSRFERITSKTTDSDVPAPFVVERIAVSVLRSCIHLFDITELRPHLRSSLHLLIMSLPKSFVKQIADRMACGLAIILRSSYHYFETPNEWTFMGDTLDTLANYSLSRVFVFDGIASTVEYAIPVPLDSNNSTNDEEIEESPDLSIDACYTLSKILIRFVLGFYQHDTSLCIPAMLCLEKVYRQRVELSSNTRKQSVDGADELIPAPDTEYWQNFAVSVYTLCRSPDPDVSKNGTECFQRVMLHTVVDDIPDEKWIDIMYLMASKQPPLAAESSRGNTFSLLGQTMLFVLPKLSQNTEVREDLMDLVHQVSSLMYDNLRHGRRGNTTVLFDATLHTATYLANHMISAEWKGESEFSSWASEALLSELERSGASRKGVVNMPSPVLNSEIIVNQDMDESERSELSEGYG